MTTTKELAAALLKMADAAATATVDSPMMSYRADTLCKCTDALIRLTRLQMEVQFQVASGQRYQLPWVESDMGIPVSLKPPEPKAIMAASAKEYVVAKKESTRLQQLRNQLGEYDGKLDGELSASERAALEGKRKFTTDRIAHFEKLEG